MAAPKPRQAIKADLAREFMPFPLLSYALHSISQAALCQPASVSV
jgi:hypothetical protein